MYHSCAAARIAPATIEAVLLQCALFPGALFTAPRPRSAIPHPQLAIKSLSPARRILAGAWVSTVLLGLGYSLEFQWAQRITTVKWWTWLECAALVETIWLIGVSLALLIWRETTQFDPARRRILRTAGAALCVLPVAGTGFGFVRRNRFHLSEVSIPIPNLPKDLDGLRIVQITDIHLSEFLNERELASAIDMANETRANLALITGDLITRRGDPLDACLRQLARCAPMRACLDALVITRSTPKRRTTSTTQGRRIGIEFLRHQSKLLRFGSAAINFAGVDYQKNPLALPDRR